LEDREDSENREDRAMADMDEPEMAMEVTELLMGMMGVGANLFWVVHRVCLCVCEHVLIQSAHLGAWEVIR